MEYLSYHSRNYNHLIEDIRNPSIRDTDLEVKHEESEQDQFAIGIFHNKGVFSKVFCQFLLLTGCAAEVKKSLASV